MHEAYVISAPAKILVQIESIASYGAIYCNIIYIPACLLEKHTLQTTTLSLVRGKDTCSCTR